MPAHRDDSTAMAPARRSLRTRPSASDGADRQIEIIDLEPALPDDFWARYKSYNFKSRTPYTNPLGLHDCAAS